MVDHLFHYFVTCSATDWSPQATLLKQGSNSVAAAINVFSSMPKNLLLICTTRLSLKLMIVSVRVEVSCWRPFDVGIILEAETYFSPDISFLTASIGHKRVTASQMAIRESLPLVKQRSYLLLCLSHSYLGVWYELPLPAPGTF